MDESRVCDQCSSRPATTVTKLRFKALRMTAALCDSCAETPRPDRVLHNRIVELEKPPETTTEPPKATVFVVLEILQRDDYYANQPLKTPIAAFLREAAASRFVAFKRTQEFISLDWEIIPVPIEDFDPKSTVA